MTELGVKDKYSNEKQDRIEINNQKDKHSSREENSKADKDILKNVSMERFTFIEYKIN